MWGNFLRFEPAIEVPLPMRQHKSEPYKRATHLRQRIAMLTGNDAKLDQDVIDDIEDWLCTKKNGLDVGLNQIGYKWIKRACVSLKIDPKKAGFWIQIRARILRNPDKHLLYARFDPQLVADMETRFECISHAFDMTVQNYCGPIPSLRRRNIISLSYILAQLLLACDPGAFGQYSRFLGQGLANTQPQMNNMRWELMINFCKKYHSEMPDGRPLHWEYTPFGQEDMLNCFLYFI